jgi:3-oxoacyl-[acyl-carrier-protein] synthase-3
MEYQTKPVKIVSMGKYLPQQVTSAEIEERYGIPEGWSEKYSGVATRHQVTFETNGYMGSRAVEKALKKADLGLGDIDLLISAGGTYDYPIPNQASVIKHAIKGSEAYDFAAIDIDSTCLSFVVALDIAAQLLDGVRMNTIVIVSSEIASKGLNPANWETISLFGDGAVAAVLQYDPQADSCLVKAGQKTYAEGMEHTMIKGGGNAFFFRDYPYDAELHSFQMRGKHLLRMAKKLIPPFMDWFFADLELSFEEVPVIIPHQASKMGLYLMEQLYDLREGQVKSTLADNGNCIAASIPLTLHDGIESGEIRRGDQCLLCGTSAGFSIGAALIRY